MKVGQRVKVVRGTIKNLIPQGRPYPDDPEAYHSAALWCAGDVPAGETGTIAPVYKDRWGISHHTDQGYGVYRGIEQIVWDNPKYKTNPESRDFWGIRGSMQELEVIV